MSVVFITLYPNTTTSIKQRELLLYLFRLLLFLFVGSEFSLEISDALAETSRDLRQLFRRKDQQRDGEQDKDFDWMKSDWHVSCPFF